MSVNPLAAIDGPLYRHGSALTTRVATVRARITIERHDSSTQLQALHQLLIEPIADLLPPDPEQTVVFIPQGSLFLVPFPALQDPDGTYLIDNHTVLTAPSIQVFGLASAMRRQRGGEPTLSPVAGEGLRSEQTALVVGDPVMPSVWLPEVGQQVQLAPLPGARTEAETIGRFLGVPALTGTQASEAHVKQRLPSARLIHLATHGLLDHGHPQASGAPDVPGALALAPGDGEDGLLTTAEILAMELQAELAILSACDTGPGPHYWRWRSGTIPLFDYGWGAQCDRVVVGRAGCSYRGPDDGVLPPASAGTIPGPGVTAGDVNDPAETPKS
ncbi:tetratricopeptide repeat domain protein [Halomicronema hongdechloris C2206]|uniref:Tetratricopeptide repeat domain protein n=1 Tax=Halomicronema hongdechloris C2206 TaxID=1641165 RepID=A0A1Z3HJY0_9CYAN|nr:CHAT domain-containing protein [Halomicronema hongdechloris]ASC70585.1 tetratricopeptide repeat domain protein [Halomicronema hongdechloris C2206]